MTRKNLTSASGTGVFRLTAVRRAAAAAIAAFALAATLPAAGAERVNLWPLFYNDGSRFQMLWPIVDSDGSNFAIRPLYSRHGSSDHWFLGPLVRVNASRQDYHILPFFWGDGYSSLFPAYIYNKDFFGERMFVTGLLHWHLGKDSEFLDTLFPLWWVESRNEGKDKTVWFAAGLTGGKWSRESGLWEHWLIPFWYRDKTDFISPLWVDSKNAAATHRTRAVPPLLSAYVTDATHDGFFSPWYSTWRTPGKDDSHSRILMGLAGRDKPGKDGESTLWTVPFFYRSPETFASPLWASRSEIEQINLISQDSQNPNQNQQNQPDSVNSIQDSVNPVKSRVVQSSWLVPPLLTWGFANAKSGESGLRVLAGAAGSNAHRNSPSESWLFPAYYRSGETLVTPVYGQTATSRWVFPVWYGDDNTFVSIPWAQKCGADGTLDWAVCPPLLSKFSRDPSTGRRTTSLLAGLAGWSDDSSWLLPLWYRDPDLTLATPFAGRTKDAWWVAPLCYKDKTFFASLLWCQDRNVNSTNGRAIESSSWCIPPLLTVHESYRGAVNGDFWQTFTFPLYSIDSKGNFASPVYFRSVSGDLQEMGRLMASATLPEEIKVWDMPVTNREGKVELRRRATYRSASDEHFVPLLLVNNKNIRSHLGGGGDSDGKGPTNYIFTATTSAGNDFVFGRDTRHTVTYSALTREKLAEKYHSRKVSLLGILFSSETTVSETFGDAPKTESKSKQSLLGWLWRREEKNGTVKVDAFPGFTYDSRPDGYSKTALLWRLFRNEKNPKTGARSVDVLFIPVWR